MMAAYITTLAGALEQHLKSKEEEAPTATGTITDIERARIRATYEQTKKLWSDVLNTKQPSCIIPGRDKLPTTPRP